MKDRSRASSSSPKNPMKKERGEEFSARKKLGRDMTYFADGMNLDENARTMLAAYDAKTMEDFFLMSDVDFRDLIHKAQANNHELPALQVRKIKMLRRWLKEVVDDHMTVANDDDDDDGSYIISSSSREATDNDVRGGGSGSYNNTNTTKKRRLVPKDWKEQYKNNLPNLKMQLRQHGDSIYERAPTIGYIAHMIGCGAGL